MVQSYNMFGPRLREKTCAMEYTIEKVLAQSYETNRFEKADILDKSIRHVFETYRQGWIELTHPVSEGRHRLPLDSLQRHIEDPQETIGSLFDRLSGQVLPGLEEGEVELSTDVAGFEDLVSQPYTLEPTRMGTHPSNEWPFSDKQDLIIKHPDFEGSDLYRRFLVTINGFCHLTSFVSEGLEVYRGYQSLRHSGENLIGAIDFAGIGDIDVQPIDIDSQLHRIHPDAPHHEGALLDTQVDLNTSSVFVCVGGYLHMLDNFYDIISENLIQLNFSQYPFLTRHMDSKDWIDLSGMPGERFDRNDAKRRVSDFYTQEYIEWLLSLPQSFLVIIDQPHVYVKRHLLQQSGYPGVFYHPVETERFFAYRQTGRTGLIERTHPPYPLITQRGRIKPYWRYTEDGVEVIKTDEHRINNYQFETLPMPEDELEFITDARHSARPLRSSDGYFVEIGKEELIFS